MQLKALKDLEKGVVTQFNELERVTVLSEEELRRVVGGIQIQAAAHCHYNYSSCSSSCGADDS